MPEEAGAGAVEGRGYKKISLTIRSRYINFHLMENIFMVRSHILSQQSSGVLHPCRSSASARQWWKVDDDDDDEDEIACCPFLACSVAATSSNAMEN
jgi:hypothetical protein